MRVDEACACGATLVAESRYATEVESRHVAFLTAHELCRHSSAKQQDAEWLSAFGARLAAYESRLIALTAQAGDRQEFERLVLERLDVLIGRTELTVSLHLPEVVEFLGRAGGYGEKPEPVQQVSHYYTMVGEPGPETPVPLTRTMREAAVYPDRSINDEPDVPSCTTDSFGVTVHNPEPECLPSPRCCERHYPDGCHFIRCCADCPSPPPEPVEGIGA